MTTMDEKVQELRKLRAEASPPLWRISLFRRPGYMGKIETEKPWEPGGSTIFAFEHDEDARFVVAVCNTLSELLDERERFVPIVQAARALREVAREWTNDPVAMSKQPPIGALAELIYAVDYADGSASTTVWKTTPEEEEKIKRYFERLQEQGLIINLGPITKIVDGEGGK